jgi:hypothetical protein
MIRGIWIKIVISFQLMIGILLFGVSGLVLAQDCRRDSLGSLQESQNFESEPALEQGLLALLNQHRMDSGLPPLALDDALARIARDQSQGMADQGFISHALPSGDLKVRLTRAGYPLEIARENVASAPSITIAHSALADSPGHEHNMLASDVSHVGIGITRCPSPFSNQLYIAEVFATPRQEYQPDVVEEALASRMDEMRLNGAGTLLLDPGLEQMASRSLNSISMPYKREDLRGLLLASTNELTDSEKLGLSRVRASVQLVHNPKNVSLPNYASEGQARTYGTAIRQVTDSQNQSAFLVLTLVGIAR